MSQNSLETLFAIEAIKKLKYTYLRAVDTHDWALLESTLTEDYAAHATMVENIALTTASNWSAA